MITREDIERAVSLGIALDSGAPSDWRFKIKLITNQVSELLTNNGIDVGEEILVPSMAMGEDASVKETKIGANAPQVQYTKEELMIEMLRLIKDLSERVSFRNSDRYEFDKNYFELLRKLGIE